MPLALYRDKNGRSVFEYPFLLVIDPLLNMGHLFSTPEALAEAMSANEDPSLTAHEDAPKALVNRGWRVYFIRSDADLTDELSPYLAISDGQLQESLAACWLQQNFRFSGAQFVIWEKTTTHLYTDGERILCEGHTIHLRPNTPNPVSVEAELTRWLEDFGRTVAATLNAPYVTMPPRWSRRPTGQPY
ncbi:MAG: hypothetical protein VKN33_10225 [Candidatus Sericytochromatia bacterium]|nr:hypothetical protein [Candidatus Sericytochromatia bacterium]